MASLTFDACGCAGLALATGNSTRRCDCYAMRGNGQSEAQKGKNTCPWDPRSAYWMIGLDPAFQKSLYITTVEENVTTTVHRATPYWIPPM
ncbi:hypothetical protein N7510_011051 [Penicillium lagena]|uniref:uncharacterized protein n=1 Tax=Penicillium lagena TaxID=94218 RepID=UPI0025410322|nr:uncharacterized protein N7510_011051 [Penicillium lagena]KAJ5601517.1 hypothetical protein N7510_011051 [Penicillium lagena]